MDSENKSILLKLFILAIPIWLTVVYLVAFWLELKVTSHGPLNKYALGVLFTAPAIGGIPIFTFTEVPVIIRIIAFPAYYLISILVSGFIGWGLCMEMHTCH